MINILKSEARGHANHGWLDSFHTFSFGDYYDPKHMGFRQLRVINQDKVAAGQGFGTHPHRDMEIISYVVSGTLAHKDSMGTGASLKPGDVQVMSAGTGVTHSEFNGSKDEEVRFLQIWLQPDKNGHTPRYADKHFSLDDKRDRLRLIASPDAREGSLPIHQDALVYASVLGADKSLEYVLGKDRHAWLQVVRGEVSLNGKALSAGDGAEVSDEAQLKLKANSESEVLLFDLV